MTLEGFVINMLPLVHQEKRPFMEVASTYVTGEHEGMHDLVANDVTLVHKQFVAQTALKEWCA